VEVLRKSEFYFFIQIVVKLTRGTECSGYPPGTNVEVFATFDN